MTTLELVEGPGEPIGPGGPLGPIPPVGPGGPAGPEAILDWIIQEVLIKQYFVDNRFSGRWKLFSFYYMSLS